MSLDRRLREDLEREAAGIAVDVERNLGVVEGRTRRPAPSLLPVLIGAAALAIVVVIRLTSTTSVVGPPVAPSPSASANPFIAIAGTYQTTLDAADDPKVLGTWTMELRVNGAVVLAPPATFAGASITPTGISYAIEGDRFRTDMFYNDFCASVGTYSWAIRSGTLKLTPASESCAIRQALLATSAWTRLP